MPELIDRQAALRLCIDGDGHDDDRFTEGYNFAVCEIREGLKGLPTIEAEPVMHGRWIVHTTWKGMFGLIHSECSECKFDRNGDLSSWNFCPKCGAQMKEGADNDEKVL